MSGSSDISSDSSDDDESDLELSSSSSDEDNMEDVAEQLAEHAKRPTKRPKVTNQFDRLLARQISNNTRTLIQGWPQARYAAIEAAAQVEGAHAITDGKGGWTVQYPAERGENV